MNAGRTHVIAYDVRDPRRLVRVHRAMTNVGYALQYSVFAADFTPRRKEETLRLLTQLIDDTVDDLRIYAVPSAPFGGWSGPLLRPDGLLVPAAPAATLAERLAQSRFGAGRRDEN